ncbi:PD-(D/E)XK nuclease-like domain-containing protein [Acidovorax sp. LjRoot129]|uniref:PD-(D/E)XK nuclease-like domain-containing protein n=1 Tax=unclassified Acidovorax TaxID=2684926 RepID=UPI003ECF51CE
MKDLENFIALPAQESMKEVEVFIDIPATEYHSDPDVVGHSALLRILRSPEHFKHYTTAPFNPTPTLKFGTALHCAYLEPERFSTHYKVAPKLDRRTKQGKVEAEEWEKLMADTGCELIDAEDMAAVNAILSKLNLHARAASLKIKAVTEKSYFWTDDETGIMCRIRCDLIVIDEDGRIVAIVDLKTTTDASKDEFKRSIGTYGYDVQAAFYSDAVERAIGRSVPFYFLCVESAAPHGVALYRMGQKSIEVGRTKYRMALQLLQWCRENDSWPGYQPFGEEEEIDLSEWNIRQAQSQIGLTA